MRESDEDIPEDQKRCSHCGHLADLRDRSCDVCGSGYFVEGGRSR